MPTKVVLQRFGHAMMTSTMDVDAYELPAQAQATTDAVQRTRCGS